MIPVLAWACRYSVRDVGFVDLTNETYRHLFYPGGAFSSELAERYQRVADAVYLDANVSFRIVSDLEALRGEINEASNLLNDLAAPLSVLMAPDGRFRVLTWTERPESETEIWSLLEAVIQSPVTRQIQSHIVDAYCLVVLVHGENDELNLAARESIESAIAAITPKLPLMPKPVDRPPVLLEVSSDQRENEQTLLWSLGFEMKDFSEPQAVVMHGRGRRIGEVLRGGLITRTQLQEIMAVIGLDCECGLDRSWMQGPLIPMAWTESLRDKAFEALGFDAENPMVKTEISQILKRGPNAQFGELAASTSVESLLLGYTEEWVEEPVEEESGVGSQESDGIEPLDADGELSAGVSVAMKENEALMETSLEELALENSSILSNAKASSVSDELESEAEHSSGAVLTFLALVLVSVGGGGWILFRSIQSN